MTPTVEVVSNHTCAECGAFGEVRIPAQSDLHAARLFAERPPVGWLEVWAPDLRIMVQSSGWHSLVPAGSRVVCSAGCALALTAKAHTAYVSAIAALLTPAPDPDEVF